MERKETKLGNNFVLDSSVVIKWFSQEIDTEKAVDLRENFLKGDIEITVPDLQLYEIANALRYNKKLNELDVKLAIQSLMDIGIDIIVPTIDIIASAIEFAFRFNISLYDAYFVALANELKFTLITADEKLYRNIKELKFVKLIEDL